MTALHPGHLGPHPVQGPGHHDAQPTPDAAAAPVGADGLPGPLRIAQSTPAGGLDPRRSVRRCTSTLSAGRGRSSRSRSSWPDVGLSPEHYNRFPSEFSGGQRQRIGIARALALRPDLIVCDEPVSALDVSIQAQIINLLEDLQDEFMLTYIFIAHDLSVVRHVSDRIAVMYLGKLVETGPVEEIYSQSRHPYTASLLSAVPVAEKAFRGARKRAGHPERRRALPGPTTLGLPVPPAVPEGPGDLRRSRSPSSSRSRATRPGT